MTEPTPAADLRAAAARLRRWNPGLPPTAAVAPEIDAATAELMEQYALLAERAPGTVERAALGRFVLDHARAILAAAATRLEQPVGPDAPAGTDRTNGETGAQAHEPQHTWAVEMYDPLADEWGPGTRYSVRDRAVRHLDHATAIGPTWRDGTPVQRRLVRATTTYTIEQPAPPALHGPQEATTAPADTERGGSGPQGAAQRDCPACDAGSPHDECCPVPETHNWACPHVELCSLCEAAGAQEPVRHERLAQHIRQQHPGADTSLDLEERAERAEALLRQAQDYLAATHTYAARHDVLGTNGQCADCALRAESDAEWVVGRLNAE
jgi:hypothetical protein